MEVWDRIFKRRIGEKKTLGFRGGEPREITEYLHNPGQGWYRIYTYDAGVPFQPAETRLADEDRLALVRISLEKYREEPLPNECLDNIRGILRFFDAGRTDVILRMAYDFEGEGVRKEPDLFSLVQEHVRQLAPVVREFENRILVFQGLLVGSWGEMHSSKFLAEKRLKALEEAFRSGGNARVWLALRRPVFLRTLAGEGSCFGRRTIFDDAIGASETDLGTFGFRGRAEAGWKEPWARRDELAFLEQVCAGAPFGGEAVLPEDGYAMSPAEMEATLRRIHLSYLNCEHDTRMLNKWRRQTLRRGDAWDGVSLYDYVGAHMGYRFCVRGASVTEAEEGGMWLLAVEIENTGFGDLLQEAQVELMCVSPSGECSSQPLDWDARSWRSGSKVTCRAQIQPMIGKLHLRLYRKWDGSQIRFANQDPILSTGGIRFGDHVSVH